MRYWKKMVAGGAAMLISTGAARACQEPSAVEQEVRGMTAAQQETSWNAKGGAPSDRARAKTDAAANGALGVAPSSSALPVGATKVAHGRDPAMNCAINNTVDCLPGP